MDRPHGNVVSGGTPVESWQGRRGKGEFQSTVYRVCTREEGMVNRNVFGDDEEILRILQNPICCAHANRSKRSLHTVTSVRFACSNVSATGRENDK